MFGAERKFVEEMTEKLRNPFGEEYDGFWSLCTYLDLAGLHELNRVFQQRYDELTTSVVISDEEAHTVNEELAHTAMFLQIIDHVSLRFHTKVNYADIPIQAAATTQELEQAVEQEQQEEEKKHYPSSEDEWKVETRPENNAMILE